MTLRADSSGPPSERGPSARPASVSRSREWGGRIFRIWAITIAAVFFAFPVTTGSPTYNKCPEDTQTCLNHMVAKLKGQGWLGVWLDDDESPRVLKVTRVVAGSPAESAGFKVGDALVSVNGAKFSDNSDSKCVTCDAIKEIWKPGNRIDYVVRRKGKKVKLHPTLAALPPDAMAQMIGLHMLEHVRPEGASKDDRASGK